MKKLDIQKLHNAEHLAFMKDILGLLKTLKNPILEDLIRQMTSSVEQEDLAEKEIVKSEHTATLIDLDKERDQVYRGLVYRVKSELSAVEEERQKAAQRLQIIVDTYGNFTRHNYQKETSEIDNLIQELSSSKYQKDIELTGLNDWVNWLLKANVNFRERHTTRRDEYASQPEYDLKNIRKDTDEIFKEVQKTIDALAILQPSKELSDMIAKANVSISKWKEVIAARTKKEKQ